MLNLLIGPITTLIERLIPNKEEQDKAKIEMLSIIRDAEAKEMKAKSDVVVSEAKGESWLQRTWRPLAMMVFLSVIVNNYILAPYLHAFGVVIPVLDIAPQMWTLLTIGIGGYIAGRSGEKMMREFSKEKFYNSLRDQAGGLSQEQVEMLERAIEDGNK